MLSSILPRRRRRRPSLLLLVKLQPLLLLLHVRRHRRVKPLLLLLLLLRRRRSLRMRLSLSLRRVCGRFGGRGRRRVGDGGEVGEVRVQPRLVGGRGVKPARAIGLRDGADEAVVVLEELGGKRVDGGGKRSRLSERERKRRKNKTSDVDAGKKEKRNQNVSFTHSLDRVRRRQGCGRVEAHAQRLLLLLLHLLRLLRRRGGRSVS